MAKRTKTITTTYERERPNQVLAFPVEEAAGACGLGRTLIYALIKEGRIRSIKVGRRRLIPVRALHDFLEGQLTAQYTASEVPALDALDQAGQEDATSEEVR